MPRIRLVFRRAGGRNRDGGLGEFGAAEPPELIFEVRRASDAEARLLAMEQAEAIREMIAWMARRRSAWKRGREGQTTSHALGSVAGSLSRGNILRALPSKMSARSSSLRKSMASMTGLRSS